MLFHALDEWIITHIFEPLAWRIEYYFGIPGVRVGFVFLLLGVTCALVSANAQHDYFFVFIFIGFAIVLIARHIFVSSVSRKSGVAPRDRLYWRERTFLSILALLLGMLDVSNLVELDFSNGLAFAGLIAYIVGMYFQACNDIPPWWLHSFRFQPNTV